MVQHRQLPWKKLLTREYSFLYASYAIDAFRQMKREVGVTLEYDFFHGKGPLLTIYRIESDLEQASALINNLIDRDPEKVTHMIDRYEKLVEQTRALMEQAAKSKDAFELRRILLHLDQSFLQTLCYYIFWVLMGNAADRPAIAVYLKNHCEVFARARNTPIDLEMNTNFPKLFGRFNTRLKRSTSFMTRRELRAVVQGRSVDWGRIQSRATEYLVVYRHRTAKEYRPAVIPRVLRRELTHLSIDSNATELRGRAAFAGKVTGKARVIFSRDEYPAIQTGDILVTPMTKPDIEPYLKRVAGIVTNDGGALSHASIIAREMNIPCLVSTGHATDVFRTGDSLELDANHGVVRKVRS